MSLSEDPNVFEEGKITNSCLITFRERYEEVDKSGCGVDYIEGWWLSEVTLRTENKHPAGQSEFCP